MRLLPTKRDLFFWTERLRISRSERLAVGFLLIFFCVLLLLNQLLQPRVNYDPETYEQILREYQRRSQVLEKTKIQELRKYNPPLTVKDAEVNPVIDLVEREKSGAPADEISPASRININTAGADELQRLKGIGPAYARRIIEYREKFGNYKSIDELLKVKGIGKKRLDNIRPFIKL